MPSDYKKKLITTRCSTTVHFKNGAATFKEDLPTNTTVTKCYTDSL